MNGASAAAAMGEGAAAELDIEESHVEMTIQELRVTNEDLVQQNNFLQTTNHDLRQMVENLKMQL